VEAELLKSLTNHTKPLSARIGIGAGSVRREVPTVLSLTLVSTTTVLDKRHAAPHLAAAGNAQRVFAARAPQGI
jgi:hypothetical protein